MASTRYVILHHRAVSGEHWDLMLEHEGVLLTWQLPSPDLSMLPLQTRRIADHRLAYLEYEGPLSGGRGSVTRVEAGRVTIRDLHATLCAFHLSGGRSEGAFRLELADVPDGHWRLRSAADTD
ncbi:MAG: hypothetical protein IT449_04260 [Phycisphaerales bacterium]|nr:hypothetical protein [Phycisphaerales bacterium]